MDKIGRYVLSVADFNRAHPTSRAEAQAEAQAQSPALPYGIHRKKGKGTPGSDRLCA